MSEYRSHSTEASMNQSGFIVVLTRPIRTKAYDGQSLAARPRISVTVSLNGSIRLKSKSEVITGHSIDYFESHFETHFK